MSEAPSSRDDFCYRHPDRRSYVLCQRCGRTICPECQVSAPVGVHCVECARTNQPTSARRPVRLSSYRARGIPVVTYSLIGLTVAVYLLQLIPGGVGNTVTNALLYAGAYTQPKLGIVPFEPWRMLTTLLVHSPFSIQAPTSILHILFNMYSLFVIGRVLEPAIGRGRFLALYVIAGFGGSVAVDVLASPLTAVVGASGAIFGLMGAFFMIARRLGGGTVQLIVVIGLNLAIGFIVPGIAWEAHVGGIITGLVIGLIFVRTSERGQRGQLVGLLAGVCVVLILITVVRALI